MVTYIDSFAKDLSAFSNVVCFWSCQLLLHTILTAFTYLPPWLAGWVLAMGLLSGCTAQSIVSVVLISLAAMRVGVFYIGVFILKLQKGLNAFGEKHFNTSPIRPRKTKPNKNF